MFSFSRPVAALVCASLLSACAARSGGTAPAGGFVPAERSGVQPAAMPGRGTIESIKLVTVIDKATMSKGKILKYVNQIGGGPPQCGVSLYQITYDTIGISGEPANASEGLFVPHADCPGPYPLVGYAHGTNLVKSQLISNPKTTSSTWTPPDQDPIVVAAIFAAHGYVTAATDYLGLGLSNYPFHPYLHADSEASAVLDSMRAARYAAKQLKIKLSGRVFLTGHSQGGQSSVAAQRAIDGASGHEFDLRGDAPSSGPYALTKTFEDSLRHQSQDAPILAAYILTSYQKIYSNIYTTPGSIFQSPYDNGIDSLLPVQTFKQEADLVGKTLPLSLKRLLQPNFVNQYLTDPRSGARADTAQNDLLEGWNAKTPMFLCGGSRDPEVEYSNATAALAYFSKHDSKAVSLIDVNPYIPSSVPRADYHVVVAVFCLPLARRNFFDPLR